MNEDGTVREAIIRIRKETIEAWLRGMGGLLRIWKNDEWYHVPGDLEILDDLTHVGSLGPGEKLTFKVCSKSFNKISLMDKRPVWDIDTERPEL